MARKPQKPINDGAGAYFGGTRIPDRLEKHNQTLFAHNARGGRAIFPEPQSIHSMPPQIAAYDDEFNKRGQVASTKNMRYVWYGDQNLDQFFHDIDTVYINPLYKNEVIKSSKTADRKEADVIARASIDAGIQQFAEASSRYFGKKFKVLPNPKNFNDGTFNGQYVNPNKTLQLNVTGDNYPIYGAAGAVRALPFNQYNTNPKKAGVDSDFVPSAKQHEIWLNTAYRWRPDEGLIDGRYWNSRVKYARETAHFMHHEFGHVLGVDHPTNIADDQNTVMAYSQRAQMADNKLLPSDINFYKDAYQQTLNRRIAKKNRRASKNLR